VDEPDILFERRGTAGLVILNRPQALNAVSHDMVRVLARQLGEWESDPAVTRVIVTASGGRAFSAGGDLRALYDLGRAGRYDEALGFFRDEYALNARIKRYRKPYVAVIDGIVMGGGVGISVHGSHRVAGDRFVFAMPEVSIGFFPDIGATWFLPRLPGELGAYCALTGERLAAADGVADGVATHRVASAKFQELTEALCSAVPVDALLAAFAPYGWLLHRRSSRTKKFEEMFPEALDLLSRAIRAGHALQTALGMVADELKEPVGPEFKKTFDQQNFGLPLRDALNGGLVEATVEARSVLNEGTPLLS